MYAIHYIGGAINVKKMPKKQAVEYAKQINDNPTGAFTESVKLAQSAEARDIMQKSSSPKASSTATATCTA